MLGHARPAALSAVASFDTRCRSSGNANRVRGAAGSVRIVAMRCFGKQADLIVHQKSPLNSETPRAALAEGPLTATDVFFVRAHGSVPEIDPGMWRLHVDGLVERELELSLATLRETFPEREEVATLQCAGNRRAGLMAI